MTEITQYINPALLILVPVLLIIGKVVKDIERINSKHIPLILGGVGVVLALFWTFATSDITNWQSILQAGFTAFVQGILCAGLAVYGNQLFKQYGEG